MAKKFFIELHIFYFKRCLSFRSISQKIFGAVASLFCDAIKQMLPISPPGELSPK